MAGPSAGGQISKMIIGPGSAGSLGSFLDPKSTKEQWLHGGKKGRKKAKRVLGKKGKSLKIKSFRGPTTKVPSRGLLDPKLRGGVTIGPGW